MTTGGRSDDVELRDDDTVALEENCLEELELDGGCDGWLDWATGRQSFGHKLGLAFSNASQMLSPHFPTCSIGGFGAGGGNFLKIIKATIPTAAIIATIIIKTTFFIVPQLYQRKYQKKEYFTIQE